MFHIKSTDLFTSYWVADKPPRFSGSLWSEPAAASALILSHIDILWVLNSYSLEWVAFHQLFPLIALISSWIRKLNRWLDGMTRLNWTSLIILGQITRRFIKLMQTFHKNFRFWTNTSQLKSKLRQPMCLPSNSSFKHLLSFLLTVYQTIILHVQHYQSIQ